MKNKTIQENFRQRLHYVIPGGAHTYSRGDDQYPANAPEILERGEGAYVFDSKGEKFLDYSMGLRSVNIGYSNREIADAAYAEIMKGNNLSRASKTELKAAELMVDLIPSTDMVKFAKHGSTVTTAAIKLARAYTGKKMVAVPVEHPFFSFDDWFIGSTVVRRGVPDEICQLTLQFNYNDIDSLKKLFEKYTDQIAAVILEPATSTIPKNNFLHEVKKICKSNGAVFILDEMITGFRWHLQGAQTYFNIQPDLSTFGKAMANGFAVAALCGRREIMELGSIVNEGAERVFLTSTTHGAEMSALGAFIKTIEILKRDNVVEHFWNYGGKLINGINEIALNLNIQHYFRIDGFDCSPVFSTKDENGDNSLAYRTLFVQEMVENKVLIPAIAISASHGHEELQKTLIAVETSLKVYKKALNEGIQKYLKSPIIKPVFRKFN